MNREALAEWIEGEAESGISYRQLAFSLGTSATTINALRKKERGSIADELLQAIALRRKEPVARTAVWLDVEPPDNDLAGQVASLTTRLEAMERKLEVAYQLAAERVEPALSLNSYLLEKGINVRNITEQQKVESFAKKVASDAPAGYERFLLIVLGVIPAASADLPVVAKILKALTAEPWTPGEVKRVLSEGK